MGTIDCECEGLSIDEVRSGEWGELVVEVRKFRTGSRTSPTAYRWQCQDCGRRLGRKLDPEGLPFGQEPRLVKWGRDLVRERPKPSSLQRRRARKRSSSSFQAQRLRVLERDSWTCQGCGETDRELLEVHHVRYPDRPEDDVEDRDLQTACGACNLAEREDRMNGGQGGRVGV